MEMLLALIIGFFCFEAAGYVVHRLLHTKWTGSLNRAHMTHHLKLYPPHDYLSKKYRNAGVDNTTYRFVVVALAMSAVIFWLAPWWIALPLLIELAAVGAINSYIHDATHIKGHWMERFALYQKWRALHYEHHVDMNKNFGIVTFLVDRVVKTYRRTTRVG